MNRIYKVLVVALLLNGVVAGALHAQWCGSPVATVFLRFDVGNADEECQGFGVVDTLSIVACSFPEPISGIAFQLWWDAPIEIGGDSDIVLADSSSGYSPDGIELFWDEPLNVAQPTVIHQIRFVWQCDVCPYIPEFAYWVYLRPHPSASGYYIEATQWSNGATIDVPYNFGARICHTADAKVLSWGEVKSLYR